MEVHLRSDKGVGYPEPQQAIAHEAAILPPVTTSSPAELIVSQALTPAKIASIFPPKEPPYIPAGELDIRPVPELPVVIPFPDVPLDIPKATGVLVLYIGADGRVDRVEVDESALPPEFEKMAIETFLQARMRPGILEGQATRVRMKILVEFEQR